MMNFFADILVTASDPTCLAVHGESCLRNPLREISTVGSVREETPGGARADLNRREAGNGGYSQGKPTAFYSERWFPN
jgi:hypothetical protein